MMFWVVYVKELKDGFRDRRSLLSAFLLPILGPLMLAMLIVNFAQSSAEVSELKVPVSGKEHAPHLMAFLQQQGAVIEDAPDNIDDAVKNAEVPFVLVVSSDFSEDFSKGRSSEVELVAYSVDKSLSAKAQQAQRLLETYAGQIAHLRLLARGVHSDVVRPLKIITRDLATEKQAVASTLLAVVPLLLLMAAFIGGLSFAIDTSAGERERRSIEPLLLTPPDRLALVLGKSLATSTFGIIATALCSVGFVLAVRYSPVEKLPFALNISALLGVQMWLFMVPTVLMASALVLALASFSKTVKEAQSSATVLIFIPMVPGMLSVLKGMSENVALSAIPFFGQQMILTQMLSESVQPMALALCTLVSLLVFALATLFTKRVFEQESILLGE